MKKKNGGGKKHHRVHLEETPSPGADKDAHESYHAANKHHGMEDGMRPSNSCKGDCEEGGGEMGRNCEYN